MSNVLEALCTRLNRVQEHIQTLERLIDDFGGDPSSYRIGSLQDHDALIITYEALTDPPILRWAPVLTDITNGLRTVLDNGIWALSVRYQRRFGNRPPAGRVPYNNPWRQIAFPIATTVQQWNGQVRSQLRFIDPNLVNTIRDAQPFHTGQHAPNREPLAILQELWNIDKHRHPPIVNVWVGGNLAEIVGQPNPPIAGVHFETEQVNPRRVLKLNTPVRLGRLRIVVQPGVALPPGALAVDVHHHIPFQIAFKSGYPGEGQPVTDTLERAKSVALLLVGQLQSMLPRSL